MTGEAEAMRASATEIREALQNIVAEERMRNRGELRELTGGPDKLCGMAPIFYTALWMKMNYFTAARICYLHTNRRY